MDQLSLGGRRRGFSPSSSVSSSITHQRVICVCILLPYSFTFHFTTVIIWICVRVVCLFIRSHLHYSALRIKLVYNLSSCNFDLRVSTLVFLILFRTFISKLYLTHTHTHIYIYIYICTLENDIPYWYGMLFSVDWYGTLENWLHNYFACECDCGNNTLFF